jgi:hypothetical protein
VEVNLYGDKKKDDYDVTSKQGARVLLKETAELKMHKKRKDFDSTASQ